MEDETIRAYATWANCTAYLYRKHHPTKPEQKQIDGFDREWTLKGTWVCTKHNVKETAK